MGKKGKVEQGEPSLPGAVVDPDAWWKDLQSSGDEAEEAGQFGSNSLLLQDGVQKLLSQGYEDEVKPFDLEEQERFDAEFRALDFQTVVEEEEKNKYEGHGGVTMGTLRVPLDRP